MNKQEQQRLKDFMREHFPFSALKQAGFYPKDMKHTEYERQAARVCKFYGYESVYEYARNLPQMCEAAPGVVVGTMAAEVDTGGQLQPAVGFMLTTTGRRTP